MGRFGVVDQTFVFVNDSHWKAKRGFGQSLGNVLKICSILPGVESSFEVGVAPAPSLIPSGALSFREKWLLLERLSPLFTGVDVTNVELEELELSPDFKLPPPPKVGGSTINTSSSTSMQLPPPIDPIPPLPAMTSKPTPLSTKGDPVISWC